MNKTRRLLLIKINLLVHKRHSLTQYIRTFLMQTIGICNIRDSDRDRQKRDALTCSAGSLYLICETLRCCPVLGYFLGVIFATSCKPDETEPNCAKKSVNKQLLGSRSYRV